MIDWNARIDDLMDTLRRQEGIEDRMAVEVLLSALIDCPRTPTTWLILETNWFDRDCLNAWFSFGHLWRPTSLLRLRRRAPWREVENEMQGWLENPDEKHLFIEPQTEAYPHFTSHSQSGFVLQRSPRIRSLVQRAPTVLAELDGYDVLRRQAELAICARAIVEDRFQARPVDPPKFVQPPDFLYYAELVQKLAPWYPDWRLVLKNLAALAVRHAYLHGRAETGPEEHDMLSRVMADMVPSWIARGMRILVDQKTAFFRPVEVAMRLEQKNGKSIYAAHFELKRLRRTGIIELVENRRWFLAPRHRRGVERLLEGLAFSAPPIAARSA